MAILLLGGTITPVLSQSSPETDILINEVEIRSNSSSSEYVELYNPTSNAIDIGGWSIVPTATWKTLEIPSDTIIESQSFLLFTHVNFWFNDFGDTISLYDGKGKLVDETPLLVDQETSPNSWQRVTDGLDTNSKDDWSFKRITPKSSNGSISEIETSVFTMNAKLDKNEYMFGEGFLFVGGRKNFAGQSECGDSVSLEEGGCRRAGAWLSGRCGRGRMGQTLPRTRTRQTGLERPGRQGR